MVKKSKQPPESHLVGLFVMLIHPRLCGVIESGDTQSGYLVRLFNTVGKPSDEFKLIEQRSLGMWRLFESFEALDAAVKRGAP